MKGSYNLSDKANKSLELTDNIPMIAQHLKIKIFFATLSLLVNVGCKPKESNRGEVNLFKLYDEKSTHPVEWVVLPKEGTFLKSKPRAAKTLTYDTEKKRYEKCKLPQYTFVYSMVDGKDSRKENGHVTIPKILSLREAKTKEIGCEINRVNSRKQLFAAEDNLGAVLRLKATQKTYIKRAPSENDLVTKKCREKSIDDASCSCVINKGDEISVFLGEENTKINSNVRVQYILDYTTAKEADCFDNPDKDGCKEIAYDDKGKLKHKRSGKNTFDCKLALHGNLPSSAATSPDQSGKKKLEAIADFCKEASEDSDYQCGFLFPGHFKWRNRDFNDIPIKSKQEIANFKDDKFYWPTKASPEDTGKSYAVMTSKFGWRWGRNHNGIDIGGREAKTPIVATNAGIIQSVMWYADSKNKKRENALSKFVKSQAEVRFHKNGAGNYIVVKHNTAGVSKKHANLTSWYFHAYDLLIPEGTAVPACQKIALLGNTGTSTGPHLHFELRPGGKAQNPCNILDCPAPKRNYCE